MNTSADIVICGAGIAGISAAYYLSNKYSLGNIVIVDERPPLSLTSDKSTECYRNWWPGPGDSMVSFMNRSIDLLEALAEQSGNVFHLNRRGYLYLSADRSRVKDLITSAQEPSAIGAGPLRIHRGLTDDPDYIPANAEGYTGQPDGADLFLDTGIIRKHFPYISDQVLAALHVRRAGWLSAQQLGALLLNKSRSAGVRLISGKVISLDISHGRIQSVRLNDGSKVRTSTFVNASGPFLSEVGAMLGVELPVYNELHLKASFKDALQCLPRTTPLLIWNDPQYIDWTHDETEFLASDDEFRWMLDEFAPGVHTRPEGGSDSDVVLMLWEYRTEVMDPIFPPPLDDQYPEIALRGLAKMLPGLSIYANKLPRSVIDGGYYTKTPENRPLIGPLPVDGTYVIGALSGYGIMAACAAGELLSAYITRDELPSYAPDFTLERYADQKYVQKLKTWGNSGQL